MRIAEGNVRGTREAGGFVSFKGLPFAAPPVGALRWRPAQPSAAWRGVRDGTQFGDNCVQPVPPGVRPYEGAQSEDCLTINVLAPAAPARAQRPVMVWIHGGAYFVGSGRSPLDRAPIGLAKAGTILVSFNYRLGRFGFFAHPGFAAGHPGEVIGNYWLSDHIAALAWVKRNIAAFGGDPANVTIFGVSAGGSSVNGLVASPAARELFARAIVQSGGGLFNVSRPLALAEEQAVAVAGRLGVTGSDASAAARLRGFSAAQILANEQRPPDYGAIVDGRLLPEDIPLAFAPGNVAKVPYLAGSTSDEASVFGVMGFGPDVLERRFGIRLPDLRPAYDAGGRLADAGLLRQELTDFLFTAGAAALAQILEANGQTAYVYRFAYLAAAQRGTQAGVGHGGDMAHLFDRIEPPEPEDLRIAALIQAYWVNFARTGNPNGKGLPRWSAFAPPAPATLVIDRTTSAVLDFRATQLKPWFAKWSAASGVTLVA